jgi:integrase
VPSTKKPSPHRVPKDLAKPLRYWEAWIELDPVDGNRQRVPLRRKDKAACLQLIEDEWDRLKEHGDLPNANQTVKQYLTYWLDKIAAKEVSPNTFTGYEVVCRKHIIPTIGNVRLSQVKAAHVRRVTDKMLDNGASSTYANNAHRIMSTAFASAYSEGRMTRNPAKQTKAPRKAVPNLEVLTLDEAIHIVEVMARPEHAELGARWVSSILTGGRRGEMIGLERNRVDFEKNTLDLSWQLQRFAWKHGDVLTKELDDKGKPLHECGRKRGTDCPVRKLTHPADYEIRPIVGGLYWTRPKSGAGRRSVPLVDPLRAILQRYIADTPDNAYGLVWAPDGYPLDPDQDSNDWVDVLKACDIDKHVRLHDVRHTAVDMLYEAGVDEDLIPLIVGHSTRAMSRSYKSRGASKRLTEAMKKLSAPFIS